MFGQIAEEFQVIFRNIRGLGKITDSNIGSSIRMVRRALIDADVNFKVVKSFISRVEKKAQGTKVLKSIKPGEQFVKIIRDELISLLGTEQKSIIHKNKPSVIILIGLQGAGKTTTSAKLALKLKESGKSILMIAADVYRPAAINQLYKLGDKINIPVYSEEITDPVEICRRGIKKGRSQKKDVLIIDTAGRLHIDESMMSELKNIVSESNPDELFFVADGMTGQDAVTSILPFYDLLPLSGAILTKMDGDTRGGAAVSLREVTGLPIKFIGTSEALSGLESFNPKRIANRILGFHDIVSIVERAQKSVDIEDVRNINKKLITDSFNFDDFRTQLQQLKSMGSLKELITLIPGISKSNFKQDNMDNRQLIWTEAIINSMTKSERKSPEIINGSRRLRISKGSGRTLQEVNNLLKQFYNMKKMVKRMNKIKKNKNILTVMSEFGKF